MDLSKPKQQQPENLIHPCDAFLQQQQQQHYMLQQQHLLHQQHLMHLQQQQSQFTVPHSGGPIQPSHLGCFEQLKYHRIPQSSPPMIISPPVNIISPRLSPGSPDNTAPVKRKKLDCDNNTQVPTKRPFKLIASKSPTSMLLPSIIESNSDEAYEQFRNTILSQVARGENQNKNMRRTIPTDPEKLNDPEYLEKRRKNNEAAKRSREARKAKEDEIAIRVTYLERENLSLKFELAALERRKKMSMMLLKQQQNGFNPGVCV